MAGPETKQYRVLIAGFLLGAHREINDCINLFDEQATNLMPPFDNKVMLWSDASKEDEPSSDGDDEDDDSVKVPAADGEDDGAEDLSGLSKDKLIERLEELNKSRPESDAIAFKSNMNKDTLTDLIRRDGIIKSINELNEIVDEKNKIVVDDDMSTDDLAALIEAQE